MIEALQTSQLELTTVALWLPSFHFLQLVASLTHGANRASQPEMPLTEALNQSVVGTKAFTSVHNTGPVTLADATTP